MKNNKVYIVADYTNYESFADSVSDIYGVFDSFEKAKKLLDKKAKEFKKENKYEFVLDYKEDSGYYFKTEDDFSYYHLCIAVEEVK